MNYKLSPNELKELITAKLSHNFSVTPEEASDEHYYKAIVLIVKDLLSKGRKEFIAKAEKQKTKQIYYLCMEFLMGRSLKNNLYNLGLEGAVESALSSMGIKLDNIYEQEPDAGLGNGGLGRLAACFLDGLATCGYPAMGYCLRYEYGIFSQKLVEGWQTELPDFWLPGGSVWLQCQAEEAITVLFNGDLEDNWDGNYHSAKLINPTKVTAVPYDMMVAGKDGKGISRLRLWAAESPEFDMKLFNEGDYLRAMEQNAMAEVITKVLYPEDNHAEGKSLRISQQYFLVSATIQDIVHRHLRTYETLDNLPELVAIHLNDTHPVLAISELMRILLDECGYAWDAAWDLVTRTVAYTNHTVMAEALECWSQEMFKSRIPRNYQIIKEIDKRFRAQMKDLGVDPEQIERMAVLSDGFIRMANLAVIASHSVNGVSKLHSEILKETVFKDFYTVMPNKFKNVTNGIATRRWLNQSNPGLSKLIGELIGDKYITDADELKKLMEFKDDNSVLERLEAIKLENKKRMANYIKKHNGIIVDPSSIFDVQVKRLHEYKRQHLNALHILSTYQYLRENPNADFVPKTYIFGAKAAPGYYFAKEIIRFIANLADTINKDPRVKDKLKVVYLEDYRVTVAEALIPAAEVSEQISLAGTEASGTSNMKFMINGALTIGTLDGANVEIHECVGKENMFLFGMTTEEVDRLKSSKYDPMVMYNNNSAIKKALTEMGNPGFNKIKFTKIMGNLMKVDQYMVLADFADYSVAQKKLSSVYRDRTLWNKMSLVNIANAGIFSADRSIRDYANTIWGATPVK